MKRLAILLILPLLACHKSVLITPPETFEAMVLRTEGITCSDLTAHEDGAPQNTCQQVYDPLVRGRVRAVALYPAAKDIKLSAFSYWQTKQVWNDTEPFPRMNTGAMALTSNTQIQYAFPETLEHEIVHGIVFLLDGQKMRTQEAIDNPKDADQKANGFIHFHDITCHNTSDDPFGDGTSVSSSGRASCMRPYSGTHP